MKERNVWSDTDLANVRNKDRVRILANRLLSSHAKKPFELGFIPALKILFIKREQYEGAKAVDLFIEKITNDSIAKCPCDSFPITEDRKCTNCNKSTNHYE